MNPVRFPSLSRTLALVAGLAVLAGFSLWTRPRAKVQSPSHPKPVSEETRSEPAPPPASPGENRTVPTTPPRESERSLTGTPPPAFNAATFIPRTNWENKGNSSASAALESYLWAVRNGNTEQLAALLDVTRPPEFEKFVAKLQDDARSKYSRPEDVAALMIAKSGVPICCRSNCETQFERERRFTFAHNRFRR